MAPSKGSKPEVNPWGWTTTIPPEKVELEHLLKAYRVLDFKSCDERRRNCKKNPYCCWGLGEKKWIQDAEEEVEEDDYGFREEGEFAGLQNLGATCYVNTLLQMWFHNPILRPAILRWQPSLSIEDEENYRPKCAIAQLQAMFARMKVSKRSKIDPTEFVTSLKLDTGEQQDAQEFSKLFMEVIVKLLTEYEDASIRNSVATAFRGELQNETECLGCNNKTQRQESFSELELGVRKNLNESLDELLQDETLSGSEQYFCSVCQKKQDAIRRTHLLKLPPVLNLQLMRFVFDRETYRKKKVTTTIQFPEVLTMTSRVLQKEPKPESDNFIYHLTAVLVHNGPSASSGHYVAQIKDLRTGAWNKFNDESVDPVGKVKSQKLVLKDEEGSGSDNDRKGKSKKPKLSSGNHTSQGAYMLVYTLENYVQNPEPDPEVWPYLEKLVQIEDKVFEEEFKKTKNDKDYENDLRDQRRKEIAMLYPAIKVFDKTIKSDPVAETENPDNDFQPPKKKIPRSEIVHGQNGSDVQDTTNGKAGQEKQKDDVMECEPSSSVEKRKNSNGILEMDEKLSEINEKKKPTIKNGGNGGNSTNGIEKLSQNGSRSKLTSSVSVDIAELDFVSVDWLQQWLDPNNPPPPVENSMLRCEHDKLAPPSPNSTSCLYRVVPSEFASQLYLHYNNVGPRFRGTEYLCELCVQRECKRLRLLQDLEEDYKLFLELTKKFDQKCSPFVKNCTDFPRSILEGNCWIGKDTLKNWKRLAKKKIETSCSPNVANDTSEADYPEINEILCEESNDSDSPLNSEIKCIHENLCTDQSGRKLLPFNAWTIITKHFFNAVHVSAVDSVSCLDCQTEKEVNSVIVKQHREIAANHKAKLPDLFHARYRPDVDTVGYFYVVSQVFLTEWRKFISYSSKNEPVKELKNRQLLCPHDLFMYPLMYLADLMRHWENICPEEEILCFVHPVEWDFIKDNFEVDHEIKITVNIPSSKDGLQYEPKVCDECALEWWMNAYRKLFDYENQAIYVIRRDKESQDDLSDNEDDDLFTAVQIPIKREKKERDPMAWKTNPSWAKEKDNHAVRRSQRPRRQRGEKEKTYKVSSTLTIKELKVMIMRDFKALPSDQHLFFEERELLDKDKTVTLGDQEIRPGTKLYLEIDTVTKQEDEPVSTTPETGFQGTLLMGNAPDFVLHAEAERVPALSSMD